MTKEVDRLTLVETFVRIVEARSLSAAAARLGTTQPTVSRRLAALEASLGVPLLKRSTHALQLTAAGERYLLRARELLLDWRRLEAELHGDDEAPEGLLRVVVPHAFGQELLMRPLLSFLQRHPQLAVEWQLDDRPLRMVEDGIDCAIRVGALRGDALVAQKLFEVERVIVAAPSLLGRTPPSRPSQLASLPWLALSTFYRTSVKVQSEGRSARVRIAPRFITDSLFAIRHAALAGLGLALVSRWVVEDDLARGALVHVLPRWRAPSLPVHVLYPASRFQPAKLRRFVEAMRDAFELSQEPAPGVRTRPRKGARASRHAQGLRTQS